MPGTDDELYERRAALLEINGRRVNEAMRGDGGGPTNFVCECGHLGCKRFVELTRAEYESVRTAFERFFVVPGHEIEGVDRVVERRDGYLVVAKEGVGARMAKESDPRADD